LEGELSIRIGDHDFELVSYDDEADVLYLRTARHQDGVSTHGTPEGHAVRLDAKGAVVGMTIVNARWLVKRDGKLIISVPHHRIEAPAAEVGLALDQSASK
jgi:uncharacterized protein YuzE